MSDYEPDFDDIRPLSDEERERIGALLANTRPSEELVDEDRGPDIPFDEDDLCPDCGEPYDFCVCMTDDELDEFD